LRDIAHAFGLSSVWVDEGGTGGMNYSNSSERRADLVSLTAAGWGDQLLGLVSALLPYGISATVSWAQFTAPQMESLVPALVAAVQTGILTAQEARQLIGIVPRTGPDGSWQDVSPAAAGESVGGGAAPAARRVEGHEQ
jgi:phage portal protein BeeE